MGTDLLAPGPEGPPAAPPPGGRRTRVAVLLGTVVAAVGIVVGGAPASAEAIAVSTTADGGAGSLRAAFAQASGNAEADEIVLQPGATYVLDDCAEGDLDHTAADDLTLTGNGATIEQTCAGERVVESDSDLALVEVTLTGGDATGALGGGVEADTSSVTATRVTVRGNGASTGGGIAAIRVTLTESTVSGNSATSTGGGVWADQTVDAVNTTIAGNEAGTSGGGVVVVNDTATLTDVTLAGNTAPSGANVELQPGSDALVAFGTVVAEPTGGADCAVAPGAVTTSLGSNLDSDGTCGFGAGPADQPGAGDPLLGPLGAEGGPTETRVPQAGSPLLDAAVCADAPVAVPTDQRGVARPQGPACDVGAVEVEVAAPPDPDPGPPVDDDPPPAPPAAPVAAAATFTG